MGIYRQYSDAQLESHLEELSPEQFEVCKAWQNARSFRFHVHEPGTFLDWHPAGGKFLIVVLSGELEICVTDGSKQICRAGDLRFTSDEGRGHTGRAAGDGPCVVLMVDIGE
jgi:hypothetical protein